MADDKIKIDIVSEYDDKDAKKALADAEKIDKLDPEIGITTDDQASDTLADVNKIIEQLDDQKPEVVVTADTDQAQRGIEDVGDEAQALSREDHEIVLTAQISSAKSELASLRGELDQTADKADDTKRRMDKIGDTQGPRLAGNQVSDLTGPLGDASGAASDFGGVFDGLADISEKVAGKVGLDAAKMAGAISGIGFAVAAGAAAWAFFKQRQEEARRKQEELVKGQRDLNKAIEDGNRAAAAAQFEDMYGDALDKAEEFGITVNTATDFITGQTDALPALDAEIQRVTDSIAANGGITNAANTEQRNYLLTLTDTRDVLTGAKGDYDAANGSISEQDRRLAAIAGSLGKATGATDRLSRSQQQVKTDLDNTEAALGRLQEGLDIEQAMLDFQEKFEEAANTTDETMAQSEQDVLAFKQFVLDTGTELGRSPIEIETVLNKVESGDLYGAKAEVQTWFDENPVSITIGGIKVRLNAQQRALFGNQVIPGLGTPQMLPPTPEAPVATPMSAGTTTVNVNMPRGSRGVDVLRQVTGQARRSGRRYGVPVVHYARR